MFPPGVGVEEGAARPEGDAGPERHCQLLLVRGAGLPAAPPPWIRYRSSDAHFQVVAEAGWEDGGDAVALLLAPLVDTPPGELEVGWPDRSVTVSLPPPWKRRLTATETGPA
jgi:hypothetical protein